MKMYIHSPQVLLVTDGRSKHHHPIQINTIFTETVCVQKQNIYSFENRNELAVW